MKIRVFALPGGNVQVFVDEGTFEEAKVATNLILAQLRAQGMPVELVGQIEQHKDDVTHVHIQQDTNQQL
ncbi:MAG: hypothetical protein NVS2B12_31150 [Ktedonobacteraceae bacterium]